MCVLLGDGLTELIYVSVPKPEAGVAWRAVIVGHYSHWVSTGVTYLCKFLMPLVI